MTVWATGERERRLAELDEQGFTILEGVVPEDLRLELVDTIDRSMDAVGTPLGTNVFLGRQTRRLFNLLLARPHVRPGPAVRTDALAGRGRARRGRAAVVADGDLHGPGPGAQPFHCRRRLHPAPPPARALRCVAIWALTDFTPENGATRIVPGSHRFDHIPGKGEVTDGWVEAVMPAGSVLVYDGSAWHGGGANRTDERRLGIVCNHCAGWVRQEEDQLLALDRDYVARLPPRLQRMVGLLGVPGAHGPRRPGRPRHLVRRRPPQRDGLGQDPLTVVAPPDAGPARPSTPVLADISGLPETRNVSQNTMRRAAMLGRGYWSSSSLKHADRVLPEELGPDARR